MSSRLIFDDLRFFKQVIGHGASIPESGSWFAWFRAISFLKSVYDVAGFVGFYDTKTFLIGFRDYSRAGC